MIARTNHVVPMQVSDTRTGSLVSPTRPTTAKSSRSTVFPLDSDFTKETFTPDSPHTNTRTETNFTNTEDRPSTPSTQNNKGEHIRTSSDKPYTGGSVFCFLNNNVVAAHPDMNSYRKFRMRGRIFLLTVMTVGFFTTMVYSLLFSCCTVISVDRAALPTRWEPGVGQILSNTLDLSSATDMSLTEADRSLPTSRSGRYAVGRTVSQSLGIGSSEIRIVPSRFADRDSVLDREFQRKRFETRKILLASSPHSLLLSRSLMSHSPGSPRAFVFDSSSQISQTSIQQQKVTSQRTRVAMGRAQHRHHQTIQMQQDINRQQQGGLKSTKEHTSQSIGSLKDRNGQGFPTNFIFGLWNRNYLDLPEKTSSTESLPEKPLSTRAGTQNNVTRHANNTTETNALTPVNDENNTEEGFITRVVTPKREEYPKSVGTQIINEDAHDMNNFIDFKNILSKSKTEKSAKSYAKSYSDSNNNFADRFLTEPRGALKTPLPSNRIKQTLKQWKYLTLPTRSVNFNMNYYSGIRDTDSVKAIVTPHRGKSQINIKTFNSNVPGSYKTSGRGVTEKKNVIQANKQEDYDFSLSGDAHAIVRSDVTTETPVLRDSTKNRTGVTKNGIINEQTIFVDVVAQKNPSHFEYRDAEDVNSVDYNVGDDANNGTEGVGSHHTDVKHEKVDHSKHRVSTRRTVTKRLTRSLSLSQRTKHNQLSTAVQTETQGSLSPSSHVVAVRPSFSTATQHRGNTYAKQSFGPSRMHRRKPTSGLQASLKNQSASQSSSSSSLSSLSIASVLASAPLTADKFDVGTPFNIEGHSGRALLQHDHSNRPPGVRDQTIATKKLPQAIIIGVKKGGTRAVLEFLRLHPNVRAPGPEPHFFDRHYQKGFEWYRNKMPATFGDQITIEKTPSYFVTKDVPRRIYNMSRDVKLIVVVRDPVTRAISDYTQTVSKRHQVRSFEQMVFINNTRIVDTSWGAIRIGVYAKHVSLWLKFFNLSQIHFVNGERLITDPAGEMAQLQDFLGLTRFINERHFYFNETKGFPCLKKLEGSGHPHCLGKTKGRTHPIISQKVLKRLRDFYRPFNSKFYQIVNKDFRWS